MMTEHKKLTVKMLAITEASSIVQKSSHMKSNTKGVLYLKEKQKSTSNSLSSELAELLLLKQKQLADDKSTKLWNCVLKKGKSES